MKGTILALFAAGISCAVILTDNWIKEFILLTLLCLIMVIGTKPR